MLVYLCVCVYMCVYVCVCVCLCVGDHSVQPPSGDPWDLDYGHANCTRGVRRTGVPFCSLCLYGYTEILS